jgi:hypothetical protein
MHSLRFNPYRSMRGAASLVGPTNNGTIALYNNGAGADILGVWMVTSLVAGGVVFVSFQAGQVGTAAGTVAPVVTGEPPQSGLITSLDTATIYQNGIGILAAYPVGDALPIGKFPSYFLQPKMSLVVQAESPAQDTRAAFLWQAMHPADMEGRPCPVCFPFDQIIGGRIV